MDIQQVAVKLLQISFYGWELWGNFALRNLEGMIQKKSRVVIAIFAVGVTSLMSFLKSEPTGGYSFKGSPTTKEQLGEVLFFEKALSLDSSISCASCHIPEHGFADTAAFSHGVGGKLGKRNAPSCANVTDRPYLFYDGRAASLEAQAQGPIEDKNEMANTIGEAARRLNNDAQYVAWFQKVFQSAPTPELIKTAIASFERTLETSKTPFDRYMVNEDSTLLSISAQRGRELFFNKAKCIECHFSPDFTGDEFRNVGLFDGKKYNDSGRYNITKDPKDMGKFKVPGLRNVAVTGPYMHNGMFKTLKEVIEYYNEPAKVVKHPINMDTTLQKPLHLSKQEMVDIEAFLVSLTDDRFHYKSQLSAPGKK